MGWDGIRLAAAVTAGRLAASLSRRLRLGGGTTMPGRVARALHPQVVSRLAAGLRRGCVVVTGTNGKTTTARLIGHILARAGIPAAHNRAGANLAAGIVAALVERSGWTGRPRVDAGIFEVDEATVPLVWAPLRPRVAVLCNLFRDQLDRYGEIDLVSSRWRTALAQDPGEAVVVYNADDPLVADVGRTLPRQVPFGIADASCGAGTLEHAADARYCYRCGQPYQYAAVYFGHMGQYRCPRCGVRRPEPVVAARDVDLEGLRGTAFTLSTPAGERRVRTVLPGLYNVHNVLAAAAACLQLGVPLEQIAAAVEEFRPAFGRAERVRVNGREAVLLLAKNPAGFNEVLRTVLHPQSVSGGQPVLLVAINDLTADGRDVSWLWDTDVEMLAGRVGRVVVSGLRAYDMAVRLKYAGLPAGSLRVQPDLAAAWEEAVAAADGPVYALLTYTALLNLREILRRRGLVRGFWED
ncbi:MAG: MurT ligase domain-containing protein [Armatimonadota bacterium]|nr:MurT ligase domain-containing protein [Armatimonadota bacterium]MDR7436318.1 MurT ligase domain-containing protein [Armatimonadota bacterium]MDR7471302.1 MurT ligase domain-containing protein [Armatimonadota bacterium]MDR7506891.1 MurT ligase domain-containing protein [Armatimonadota bacterium]MDR7509318.1 MurT ligase domain-containing protein [Armatimonadota bacterium]